MWESFLHQHTCSASASSSMEVKDSTSIRDGYTLCCVQVILRAGPGCVLLWSGVEDPLKIHWRSSVCQEHLKMGHARVHIWGLNGKSPITAPLLSSNTTFFWVFCCSSFHMFAHVNTHHPSSPWALLHLCQIPSVPLYWVSDDSMKILFIMITELNVGG